MTRRKFAYVYFLLANHQHKQAFQPFAWFLSFASATCPAIATYLLQFPTSLLSFICKQQQQQRIIRWLQINNHSEKQCSKRLWNKFQLLHLLGLLRNCKFKQQTNQIGCGSFRLFCALLDNKSFLFCVFICVFKFLNEWARKKQFELIERNVVQDVLLNNIYKFLNTI